jgi:plasmid stabilization system protein ParE
LETDARRRARFLEEGIGPEFKDTTRRPWVSIGAEHDDGRSRAGITAANETDEFESVNARQMKICNHSYRGAVLTQYAEGARGIARITHGTSVVSFQRHLESHNRVLAIFHQEDKWR